MDGAAAAGKWELWANDKDGETASFKGRSNPLTQDFLQPGQTEHATDRKLVVQDWQPDSAQTCLNEARALSNGEHCGAA